MRASVDALLGVDTLGRPLVLPPRQPAVNNAAPMRNGPNQATRIKVPAFFER
jgi:hypothetical protein